MDSNGSPSASTADGRTWFALRHHGEWTIMLTQNGGPVLSMDEMATLISNAAFEPD